MPRKRLEHNVGLPTHWHFVRGAYYYRVPADQRKLAKWHGRTSVRLGPTLAEATEEWQRIERLRFLQMSTPKMKRRIWPDTTGLPIPKSILQHMLVGANNRAQDCDLTPHDLVALARRSGGACEVTGIKFDLATKAGKAGKAVWAASLDRIDSALGYTLSNCRIVCAAVNIALSDFGDATFAAMALAYAKRQGWSAPNETIKVL